VPTEAFFLPAASGQRFCVFHTPAAGIPKGALVYVHPFAEEMNKSRRMAALQSQAFAEGGFAVLQIDLLGCGDSSGDFGDATWTGWVDDVIAACAWVAARVSAPLWLWGLRAGCLLVADAAQRLDGPCNFLFWQPASSGKTVLQQFLRLKVAGDILAGQSTAAMDETRRQLERGEAVEIAGYAISPALAAGLERATLLPSAAASSGQRVEWLELSSRADASLSPASVRALGPWREAGVALRSQVVGGPAFWQTTEIEHAPQLLAATLAAVARGVEEP
jgi:uncharacterized protein